MSIQAEELPKDYYGWTVFPSSSDKDVIFVSQSGDDNNDGRSADTPVRHISRALQIVNDGDGDWILLNRGDTFTFPETVTVDNQTTVFEKLWISYSGDITNNHYMLIADYGNPQHPRPIIKSEVIISGAYIALQSLHIHGDGNNPDEGLKLMGAVVGAKQNGSTFGNIFPTSGGVYGQHDMTIYFIEIDGDGIPNTFKWRVKDGPWTTEVPCLVDDDFNSGNYLSHGVGIVWNNTTGGVMGDSWEIPILTTGASPFHGEDLLVEGWSMGIEIEDPDNVTIRRCVIIDNSTQGMFIGGVGHRSGPKDNAPNNLRITENIFDNNGSDGNTQHNIYKVRGGHNQYYDQNYFLDDHFGTNNGIKIRAHGSHIYVLDNIFSGIMAGIGAKGDAQDYEERFHSDWHLNGLLIHGNTLVDVGGDSTMIGMSFANTKNLEVYDNLFGKSTYAHRNQAILFQNQSVNNPDPDTNADIQIEAFQVRNNHFINFQSVAIELASYIDGNHNDIYDNFFHLSENDETLTTIMAVGDTHETFVNWRNNSYYSPYDSQKWFEYADNKLSCEQFTTVVNETNYTKFDQPQTFNDENATLAQFNLSLGGLDTLNHFRMDIRNQRKHDWDPRFEALWAKWYFQKAYSIITGDTISPRVHKIQTLELSGETSVPVMFINVTYTDNDAVIASSLGDGDITVVGQDFVANPIFFFKTKTHGTENAYTATYFLKGPGDEWDESDNGTYTVIMNSGQVSDLSGNLVAPGELGEFTCAIHASQPVEDNVMNRQVFYNNSTFDNNNPAATLNDYNAIATDKQALLPGQTASFVNYTSYDKGVNGIIIDIRDLPDIPSVYDFIFQTGNDNATNAWLPGPQPTSITVRAGQGVDGSDRITLIFADKSIMNTWLKVTIKSNDNTGLELPDVFYFGNAIGETGDNAANTYVDSTDEIAARNHPRNFLRPAPVDYLYDFNRDKHVNATDQMIARNNGTNFTNSLQLIKPQ